MANGGRLRGGLGGIPGLGGYLGGRQLNRERQTHDMNMQNQRQVMRQRKQQIEALMREAEQYEANEELRGLQRELETAQVREGIEDQPDVARQEDLQREREIRESEYILENWGDLKAREQQQALLDMEEQRAGIEGTRAEAQADRQSAQGDRIQSRLQAVNLVGGSIPEDPSNMTQRDLTRLRRRASSSGYDPDDLGIPQRIDTPASQQQLRQIRSRAESVRDHQQQMERIRERKQAELWLEQQKYEQGLESGERSRTQLAKHMAERDQLQRQIAQAEEAGNTEQAESLRSDLNLYEERIQNYATEAESRGAIVAGLYSKVINGQPLTRREASVLRYEAVNGNPIAGRIQESMGTEFDQYVQERDEETPGQQETTDSRARNTPTEEPRFTDDTMVETSNGEARFGDLVDTKVRNSDMNEEQARQHVRGLIEESQNN